MPKLLNGHILYSNCMVVEKDVSIPAAVIELTLCSDADTY